MTHPIPLTQHLRLWFVSGLLGLFATGCASDEIKQYRVPKVAAVAKTMAPADERFTFTTPAGWQKQPASQMRLASLRTQGGGDVSVVALPGAAGDLKGNINRWRGQVGLAPIDDIQAVLKNIKPLTVDGNSAIGLEIFAPADKPNKAMRVAMFEQDGLTWFFKLAGTRELVTQQKAAFLSFIQSVQIKKNKGLGQQAPPLASPSEDTEAKAPAMPPLMPQSTNTRLTYTLPTDWIEKPKDSIRIASFAVKKGQDAAEVSIVNLAGDGGGLLSNANRWRQQLEMAPTDQAGLKNAVKDIDVNGHKGYFMALYTGMAGQGMLIAMVGQGGQTWFIKMVGSSRLIQTQEKDFQTFVKSIQFHEKGNQT